MPDPLVVPNYQPLPEYTILPPPDQAYSFAPHEIQGESSSASKPLLDRDTLINALASSPQVQRASGWDQERLLRRLDTTWSVENALKNCTSNVSYSIQPKKWQCADGSLQLWIVDLMVCNLDTQMPTLPPTRSLDPNLG